MHSNYDTRTTRFTARPSGHCSLTLATLIGLLGLSLASTTASAGDPIDLIEGDWEVYVESESDDCLVTPEPAVLFYEVFQDGSNVTLDPIHDDGEIVHGILVDDQLTITDGAGTGKLTVASDGSSFAGTLDWEDPTGGDGSSCQGKDSLIGNSAPLGEPNIWNIYVQRVFYYDDGSDFGAELHLRMYGEEIEEIILRSQGGEDFTLDTFYDDEVEGGLQYLGTSVPYIQYDSHDELLAAAPAGTYVVEVNGSSAGTLTLSGADSTNEWDDANQICAIDAPSPFVPNPIYDLENLCTNCDPSEIEVALWRYEIDSASLSEFVEREFLDEDATTYEVATTLLVDYEYELVTSMVRFQSDIRSMNGTDYFYYSVDSYRDNSTFDVLPEPSSTMLGLAAIGTLGALTRSRQTSS
jgi:hypothetical protein